MRNNQKGFIEEFGFIAIVLVVIGLFGLLLFSKWEWSSDNTSGIVYNTTNDSFIGGNTGFSIRAGENTPVTEENQSKYCVPGDSPYKELINRAASDKRVKVNVTTAKGFWFKAPWTCIDNVTVVEVKQ